MSHKRSDVSREVVDRLVNLTLVAIGNILIIAGENLIQKGNDGLNPDTKDKINKGNKK